MTRKSRRKPVDPVAFIVGGLVLALVGGFLLASPDARGLGWVVVAVAGVLVQIGTVSQGVALGMAWFEREYRRRPSDWGPGVE